LALPPRQLLWWLVPLPQLQGCLAKTMHRILPIRKLSPPRLR
jgi:hypothetical protein